MIEVMVALLLTALVVMGLQALLMSTSHSTDRARRTTAATVLAQDKIEYLRTQGAAATFAAQTDSNIDEYGAAAGTLEESYTRVYSETYNATVGYADITVSVSWSDSGGQEMVTLHARRGP